MRVIGISTIDLPFDLLWASCLPGRFQGLLRRSLGESRCSKCVRLSLMGLCRTKEEGVDHSPFVPRLTPAAPVNR